MYPIFDDTPIITASKNNDMAMISLLLKHGANINAVGGRGDSALHEAVRNQNLPIIKYLLSEGINVDLRGGRVYETALLQAVKVKNPEIVQILVDHGADVMLPRHHGHTSVDYATGSYHSGLKNEEILKILLKSPTYKKTNDVKTDNPTPQTDFTPKPVESNSVATTKASEPQPVSDSVATNKSPVIMKGIYGSRTPGTRGNAMSNYGGIGATERAVLRSLRWFKKIQNEDGSWSTDKDPKALATGITLLPFLAHGETPASGEFGSTFENAINYLLSIQDNDGRFEGTDKNPAIEHGIITYALCEIYGLTRIPKIKDATVKAVNIILESQLSSGLWSSEYDKGEEDIEASVWQVLALKAAMMAGLQDERLMPALKKTAESLKKHIINSMDEKTIAPALLCMQLTGCIRDPICRKGIGALDGITMNWENPEYKNPVYHWHFISEMSFHAGGDIWNKWNKNFAPALAKAQKIEEEAIRDRNGRLQDCGYWISPGKNERYGTIYSTALCCMMFEVYYAYRPTYKPPEMEKENPKDIEIEIEI